MESVYYKDNNFVNVPKNTLIIRIVGLVLNEKTEDRRSNSAQVMQARNKLAAMLRWPDQHRRDGIAGVTSCAQVFQIAVIGSDQDEAISAIPGG